MRLFVMILLAASAAVAQDWPMYGGDYGNTHYSALKQIDRANVQQLKVAWTFDTGDAFPNSEIECNPLIIDGVLYASTPKANVIALNAATGALLWRFDPENPIPGHKMRHRGLASWSDGHERRIFAGVREYIYALDAKSGQLIRSFGVDGRIDLRKDLSRPSETEFVRLTSPVVVYKDLLIAGGQVSESLPAAPGDIRAWDVHTGKLRWSFHTIPLPGEFGANTWPADAFKVMGGANNWAGMTLDVARGLLFVPTGSAAFDFYGANRIGDNLFANTLLALDAATGKRVWHYQMVRHDLWDRDLPTAPTLVKVRRGSRDIDAVAQITKSAHVFLFDRKTGQPLFPIEERAVPGSAAVGESTAPKQPLPTKPPPFSRQKFTEEIATNRTPEAHAAVVARLRALQSGGQFVPPSVQGTVIFPGLDGGGEWGGATWDPESGLLYVNANEMPWIIRLVDHAAPVNASGGSQALYVANCASCHGLDMKGSPPEFPSLIGSYQRLGSGFLPIIWTGAGRMPGFRQLPIPTVMAIADYIRTAVDRPFDAPAPGPQPVVDLSLRYGIDGYNRFLDPDGYPAVEPPWGTLTAIDLNKGEIRWRIPLGEYPELAAKGMKDTGSENYGGSLVTAGGLLFIAATSLDKKFRAFDKLTGALLWETILPASGNATPATYAIDGRQFLVIAAGGGRNSPSGGKYVAFALPN